MRASILAIVLILGVTVVNRESTAPIVHAQLSSPAYLCNTGLGAVNSGFPCAQYLIEVVPQRLGGGVFIYQIQDQQVDVRSLNAPLVTAGPVNGSTTIQVFQPGSDIRTVTLAVSAP